MKVALIQPPLSGHETRGTGSYTRELYEALKSRNDQVDVELIRYTDSKERFDLIHYPYFDPFFLTLPLVRTKPTVVTVHDLIPLAFSHAFPKGIRGTLKWYIQRLSLLSSSAVITDSFASKKDIVRHVGIPADKIHVIYLAADQAFRQIKNSKKLITFRKKLRLAEKFILHVGDLNYNKNIKGLLKAFQLVRKKYSKLQLVLVGKGFVSSSPQLDELLTYIKELNIETVVKCLGFVSQDELIGLYNLATVYVQPSFAEGFGLPVLEAMACGCPVIAGNKTSLPEIVGNAGLLIDPSRDENITRAIVRILSTPKIRIDLIQQGFIQARRFSWEKCADETIEIYQDMYEKERNK